MEIGHRITVLIRKCPVHRISRLKEAGHSWIDSRVLDEFFGQEGIGSTRDAEYMYEVTNSGIKCEFRICQADRYACVRLASEDGQNLFQLELPLYGWIRIEPQTLWIGPPRNLEDVRSGRGMILCPVALSIAPQIKIEFDRRIRVFD